MELKTPGVYIVEKNAFPNSVAEVATAVPAFIGYTEKAANGDKSLLNRPWRITSAAEYGRYFGGSAKARFKFGSVTFPALATPPATAARSQSACFDWNGRQYQLARAAGKEGGRFLMHQALQHFFQNGGGPCYIVSVGGYDTISAGTETTGLIGGLKPLLAEQEATMVLVPDAVLLDEPGCIQVQQQVLRHCGGAMRNRVAILDVRGGDCARQDVDTGWDCVDNFRHHIGIEHLGYAAACYPWLHSTLVRAEDLDYSIFQNSLDDLVNLLEADLGVTKPSRAVDTKLEAIGSALEAMLDTAAQKDMVHKNAVALSPLYAHTLEEARRLMNVMPPSAAMAGLYTMVDNTRGVWNAPANVSVASVVAPTVQISHDEQEDLNVAPEGKSINAIRSFIGEGTLVWGARTLDGNSLDWRYINARRTMIMLEESCRLAAKAMVFEPNAANTWVTIQSMIANFLTGIWKRGGLAGAVPQDAFSVHVGLGETMTAEDILEGILRATVLVAISRPAEFIEITFQQQLQKA